MKNRKNRARSHYYTILIFFVQCRLEDIFYNYGVDIVLQAHEHSYERLWPQYKGVVLSKNYTNPQAPVQLISGAAGSRHRDDPEKTQRGIQ